MTEPAKKTPDSLAEEWKYEFEEWRKTTGFDPVELVASADESEDYDQDRAHVFLTSRGEYALVHEAGCSCYSPSDASIDLFPNLEAVKQSLRVDEDYKSKKTLLEVLRRDHDPR